MTKTFVTGEVLTAADTNTFLVNNGFQFVGTRYYESSGTFAKADPFGNGSFDGAKLRAIRVRMVGGGGGAGGAPSTGAGQTSASGSGGGAGFAEKFITNIAGLSTSETVSVGGAGAAGATEANGSTGGTSSAFTVTASGGGGGTVGSASAPLDMIPGNPGGGGIGSGGDFNARGEAGSPAFSLTTARLYPSIGGGSLLSPSGVQRTLVGSSSPAISPSSPGFGVGAAGARNSPSVAASVGAAGLPGIVIVDVFA